jgi:hypothetical protein
MKTVHWIVLGLLTLATLGMQFLDRDQASAHAWESIPLFHAAFGFLGCLLWIVIAKKIGKALLEKPEDYYERDR